VFVAGTHVTRGDKADRLLYAAANLPWNRHYPGNSNSKWQRLLLESRRSYGNTGLIVRTRRHDPLHLGQMDPSAFAMRSESKRREWDQIRGRQPVDRWHDASTVDLVTSDPESKLRKSTCCRKLLCIKKNRPTKMIAGQLAGSWKINLFPRFFKLQNV